MYFVKYGDNFLHDPRLDIVLNNARLDTELNSSDVFTFSINPNHELYNLLKERDRENPIIVYEDDTIIFRGEITTISDDFYLTKNIECRGEMSYLNDTIVRPYSTYAGDGIRTAPNTVIEYFNFLINEHNSQVDPSKQFIVKNKLTSSFDKNGTIYRSDITYPTVGDTIKSKILDSLGLYVEAEYNQNGTRTITLIDNFDIDNHLNAQVIDFGVNLLDFVKEKESIEIATYVIPIGDDIEDPYDETSSKLKTKLNIDKSVIDKLNEYLQYTIEYEAATKEEYDRLVEEGASEETIKIAYDSWQNAIAEHEYANGLVQNAETNTVDREIYPGYVKSGYMIYSTEGVNRYGWIGKTVEYDNVHEVSYLILNGFYDLLDYEHPTTTIELNAIDLSLLNKNYKTIKKGQYIRAKSDPHKFDSYMLCSKVSYDLIKPDNNLFTLGTVYKTFTQQSNKTINELNDAINSFYSTVTQISDNQYYNNNAITVLSSDINNTDKRVDTVSGNVTALGTQVGTLSGNVTALGTQVGTLNTTVSKIKDFISDVFTTDPWSIRKWNNGMAECYAEFTENWTSESILGNLYYRSYTKQLPINLFNNNVKIFGSVISSTGTIFDISFNTNNKDSISYYIYSIANVAKTVKVQIHVVGTYDAITLISEGGLNK